MSQIAKPTSDDSPRHARILYENLLVSSSSLPSDKALTPNTYERWIDSFGAMLHFFRLAEPTIIDTVAIAAHNLGSVSVTISIDVASSIGGPYVQVGSISPKDNKPIMFTFDPLLVEEVRFTGAVVSGDIDKELGVIFAGNSLQMQRAMYGGHSPLALSQKTEYQTVKSEGGQFLGRNITRQGAASAFSWKHLDPDWYRENFQPFVLSARTTPFFIQWRPDKYDTEVAYVQTTGDIKPTNQSEGNGFMSVSMNVEAHSDL